MPSKLYIICEGQSESAFVNEMLCQYVGEKTKWQLRLIPITITTSTRKSSGKVFKGGLRNYGKIKNELKKINYQEQILSKQNNIENIRQITIPKDN